MNDLIVDIPGGTYVIAVSGGVDSMVLLDVLAKKTDLKLIVAHFDHGIRPDSGEDRLLVQKTAKTYKLPFVFDKVKLGAGASEADARKARYAFLKSVKSASNARAIITAHHQDDIIETAILNILRGTNRKGLSSLKSLDGMLRPITHVDKNTIYEYAKSLGLPWREDSTNKDINYRRNYIRHNVITRFNSAQRQQFLGILKSIAYTNAAIDIEAQAYLDEHSTDDQFERHAFIILPHSVSVEIMASWLRQQGIRDFDSKLLERLTISAKTLSPGQRVDVNLAYFLQINKDNLALMHREC
jgi:tRNA(Ile)-lysidine synthase